MQQSNLSAIETSYATENETITFGSKKIITITLIIIFYYPWYAILAVIKFITGSNQPIIYNDVRVGKNGRPFLCKKFRSMCDGLRPDYAQSNVELRTSQKFRITAIGWFMRRFAIDEIPQFWNILNGEMNYFGNRPRSNNQLKEGEFYGPIHRNELPGLFGPYQASRTQYREGSTSGKSDLHFCENKSFFLNLCIVCKSIIFIIFFKKSY